MHSLIFTVDTLSGPLDLTTIRVFFVDWGYQGEKLLSKAGTAGRWSSVGLRTLLAFIVQELCESRGGRPGLSVLTSLLVSVDVNNY